MTNKVKTYTFIDNSKRQRFVIRTFKLYLAVTLYVLAISIATAAMHYICGPYYDYENNLLTILIYLASGLGLMLFGLLSFVSGIGYLMWLYRSVCNMHALSPDTKFKFSPKLAIASYFIPFVCIVWPYQAMKELWNNMKSTQSTVAEKSIGIWWVSYLFYMIFDRAGDKFGGEGFQDLKWFTIFMIPTALLGLISCYQLLKLVKDMGPQQAPSQ